MDIFLIFPIHLFSNIDKLHNKLVYIIEEPRFFTDFKYHKLKLSYHRASMKSYYKYLYDQNITVKYIDFYEDINNIYKGMYKSGTKIHMYNPTDNILKNKIKKYIPSINIYNTLNFLVNEELIKKNLDKFYNKNKYNHANFYKWQRIRLNILIDKDGGPTGGKWSFDEENRKKMPKDIIVPNILKLKYEDNNYITESKEYINKYFSKNYGSLDNFVYPINHKDSKKWLLHFIHKKFKLFGIYEDAESMKDPFLFHSVLSPMMNIGLITDNEVLNIVLKYKDDVPINSFEGFIRQIIGWRNYIYSIYLLEGDKLSKINFFNHKNIIQKDILWTGKTDILPIDNIIKKINDYSYAHHIERLMYLGNYMLICMVDPKYVYEIFMEWTIDAYEWVMIPNVYGMSQYADGGIIMTRPYFASSNYILKMSDYKKDTWCKIYDALYYNFINEHEKYLASNYATSRQVAFWRKKDDQQKKEILNIAKKYLLKVGNLGSLQPSFLGSGF
jgi:deoxyribodipyrimidine photolyase-related protein